MAEKKSWRDYSEQYSTDEKTEESTSSKKTGSWRDYTSESTGRRTTGSWRNYTDYDPAAIVGEDIVNRVNGWLKNHNTYISDYQKRFSGRKGSYEDAYVSDSADWLTSVTQRKDSLKQEAQSIIDYVSQYSDYFDPVWVNSITKTLRDATQQQKQIITGATKDHEYWSSFGSEDAYKSWQTDRKQYATDLEFDVSAGETKLEGLRAEREAYLAEQEEKRKKAQEDESFWDSLGRWLGTTPDTTLPLGGASSTSGNKTTNPYDSQISELEKQIERSKYVQGYEGFMDNIEAADYVDNSKYASTRTDVAKEDALWGLYKNQYDESKLFGDFLYDYINRNEDALSVAMVNDTASNAYFLGFDKGFLQTMTDEEIGVYNYIYKTKGKESANAFLSFIENDLEGRRRIQEQAKWAAYAEEDPVGSSVFSVLTSPLKSFTALGQVADYMDDGTIDQNAGYNRFSNMSSSIRNQVASDIAKSGDWGEVGSWTYQLGMSMGDFLMNTAITGGNSAMSLTLMGSSAMADTVISAKDRGLSDDQAMILGVVAGAAEVITEKFSLDALFNGNLSKGAMRYILTNAFTEGAEEVGSSLINTIADVLVAKDKSQWEMAVKDYMAKNPGATEQEAFQKVLGDNLMSLGLDFLGGALMGGAMGGGGATINYATNARPGLQVNKDAVAQYGDYVGDLIQEGLLSDPNSESYDLAQYYQKKTSNGKTLTGYEIRNLVDANDAQFAVENYNEALPKAEKRLSELGETKDVSKIAKLVAKRVSGQQLTPAEKSILVRSQFGAQVAKEMIEVSEQTESGTRPFDKPDLTYKPLDERVGTEARFGVSEDGQATIRVTGKAFDFDNAEVVEVGDGQISFKREDGGKVSAGGIDFANDDQSYLVSAVSDIEHITPAAATAILHDIVDTAKPLGAQLNGIDEAYTYGYHGYSEADLKAGNFTSNLSNDQMMRAYKLGQDARKSSDDTKADTYKQMRTAAQAEAEKTKAEGKASQKAKNLTVTFNKGNGEVVSIDEAGITDAKQSGAVEVAKILHKMGLGTKVEFFSSYLSETLKDKKGNPARVFINDKGNEQRAYSGVYRKSDGTIRVDLNAYNGRGLTLNAMAHELTHFIQQWSDRKYKVLVDFLMKEYEKTDMTMRERVLKEQARLEEIRGEKVSYDEAYDEVVANAMSKMFDDGNLVEKLAKLKEQDKNLAQKLWEGFKKIMAKFIGIYEKEGALFKDAADLVEMKETFEQLQNMFAEALVEASENYQASITASESQTLTEAGIGFDEDTKSVYSLHFSTAFQDEIQVGKKTFDTEAIAQIVAKGTGRSIEDARKWVQSELSIANIVMANPEFLDFDADNRYEAIKKNSDYPQGTVDLSNLCPKREEFTAMFDRLQKKYPNKLFTAQDVADMRKILSDNDITVACGACFVEDRRQLIGEIADTYIQMWKEAVEAGKPLQKTNAAGQKSDLLVTKALAKQYGLTAGAKIMATDTYIPNQYDLTTYEGFKLLEKNHPTIAMGFNRYNNSRGQQSARLIEGRAEYNRQILGWSDAKVRSVNNNGGLRIFSFSDFEVVHLLDLVQVIIDCAAKGVKIQGYTKIPAFAKLVRDTGVKLNRSLIPKGDFGYHMENGKVVLDYDTIEGIDINDENFVDESDNPDVGNIVIGINPTQIGAAMTDSFIDYIIPFHSNKAKEILKKLGTGEWVNYKESQHEKDISTGKASKHNVNIYTEVINKYHPKNKVEFVEAFLKECKRQGKIPRYAEFLNVDANGDYAYREGYHKLLVDFKMFDKDGNILPQGNITPKLDEGFMKELLNAEVKKKQDYEFPQKVYDAIDEKFGEQYSSQETDMDSDGNQLSAEQKEFFKDSVVRDADGRLMVMYHGTANGGAFTVFDGDQLDNSSLKSQIGQGFYFTNMKNEAESYMVNVDIYGRVSRGKNPHLHQVYLNITNPFDINTDHLDLKKVKAVYMDGTSDHFFDSFIAHYLNNKTVKGRAVTKAEVQAMSKADRVSLYVDYMAQIGTKELLSNMVQAFSYGKQSELLASMKNRLGHDGIVEEYAPGKYQYVAFSSEQIKSVDNKTPTSDPDIRYSSQETDIDRTYIDYGDIASEKAAIDKTVTRLVSEGKFVRIAAEDVEKHKDSGDWDSRKGARQYLKRILKGFLGKSVRFNHNMVRAEAYLTKEGFNHSAVGLNTPQKAAAFSKYYALIANSEYSYSSRNDIHSNANTRISGKIDWDSFVAVAMIDGEPYPVVFKVRTIDNDIRSQIYRMATKNEIGSTHDYGQQNDLPDALPNYGGTPISGDKVSQTDDEVKSEHDTDYSNRSLLAKAFEGITQNSVEYKMLQDYKSHIKELNELESKLSDLNAEIRKIRFGTTGARDTARLTQLEDEAKKTAKEINRYDKRLLMLEASEPLRKVIERERKKEAQKTKDHVQEIQQNKKLRAEQTEYRHKIRKAIRDLDKLLNRGNKKLNVKEDLQPVVTKALQAAEILFTDNYGNYDMLRNGIGADLSDAEEALVNTCAKMLKDLDKMPTDGYENWQARQEAENRLKTKMSKLKEVFARERKRLNNTKVSSILGELADAYSAMQDSTQSYVQGAYSEAVYNFLKNLQKEVGGTIVNDMTKNQLENVYAAYKMVLNTVRNANKMFNEELKQSREQLGNAVIEEVIKAGGVHLLGTKLGDAVSQASWNNMKPIWVANRIGSDTFGKLVMGLFKGQYNFAVDIDEAKQFKLSMDEKFHPIEWDADKLYEFESSTGKKFSLNLQQIMSLYAFSKREQAYSHLLNGGFVFEKNSTVLVEKDGKKKTYIHKGAASYKLNEATLNGIINSLTAEQKAYVDEMQKYLSEVMGAKGNEVSMKLYGIQMFKEKFYFPLRSSGAYMEKAKEAEMKKQQGQINLVNSGFTHAVKPEAKNPIILSGFMDVWAEHCNEMSMYHSMVLPMEDFRKVYNYTTIHDEKMDSASVFQTIQDAYGDAATNYIDQLYRELNAGATVDPRETPFKKLISNFKKSSVMLSASVWVQQFSSIGRAYAVIDPKYFIGTRVNSDTKLSVADEMKKYAPVAIIKEMGGFDTGTKGSAKSYIMAEQYAKGERIKGLVKDEQYRGDIMGYLPAKADEKTWGAIWEATKRETKAKHPDMDVKSEEFLKLAGERFSEVIEKTQVYDSVLARSANMRSKGAFMAMATAFMAEPTTTINLLEDAIRSGNKKHMARAFGSVAVSIVLNNALASIVYAMRDDDEDETFIEKYFQSLTSGMIDDINPMSYYPFLKDVWSLFQGYDVERADMSVIADLRDATKQVWKYLSEDTSEMDDDDLAKHNKNLWGAFGSLLDAGCSVFGVPAKNVRRDVNGLINAFSTIGKDLSGERATTWNSFWDKVGAAAKDTIPFLAWTKGESKTDKLYTAIISGDKSYLARLKSTYKTDDAYQSAVRKALRENDPRIHEAAQARYEGRTEDYKRIFREIRDEGKFDFDDIMSAVNSEESKIRNKTEPDNVTSDYTASGYVEAIVMGNTSDAEAMKEDIIAAKVANGKTRAEAEKEFISSVSTGVRDAYFSGLLDEARAKKMLTEYAGKDAEEAASKVSYWAFCEDNPQYDYFTESNVSDYLEFAKPENISMDVFAQYLNGVKGLETKYDEWGDVEVSKREQVLDVINSLPLTWQQKDALYLAYGYAESKIWDVPW